MKEIKAGQRVTIILEAVEKNGCDGCLFDHDDTCHNPTYNDWADGFQCEPEDRSDGKHVIFKEVKKQKRNMKENKHSLKISRSCGNVSTIGINGSDFSFIKGNITLQISLHSFDDNKRNWLIPYKNKMTIQELGRIRTESNLKTTINLTLVDTSDFDAEKLAEWFDKEHFFVKLSPINPNNISEKNHLGNGVVEGVNLV